MIRSPNRSIILLSGLLFVTLVFFSCSNQDSASISSDVSSSEKAENISIAGSTRAKSAAENGPRIVFDETTHDFGRQLSGEDLENIFTFTNKGDGTLIIENVKAG